MAITARQEKLLDDLLKDVSALQATREELSRQNEALGTKIDNFAEEMRSLLEKRIDSISVSVSKFGERLGKVERDVDTVKTRCASDSSHRDDRLVNLTKAVDEHSDSLCKLWELEHQRKGRVAVLSALGGFIGTICGGITLAMVKVVFGL